MTDLVREYIENVIQRIVSIMGCYGYKLETEASIDSLRSVVDHTSGSIKTYSVRGKEMQPFAYMITIYNDRTFRVRVMNDSDYVRYDRDKLEKSITDFCKTTLALSPE